jgi:hypothetical protein
MASDVHLSAEEFASLSEMGNGLILGAPQVSSSQLSKLLRLKFIYPVIGGFEATAAGKFRIAAGN